MKMTYSLRSAVRAFRRRPGFFAIAVMSLGLALGASTAVFAMIDSLRHPIAANTDADRLVSLSMDGRPDERLRLSPQELIDLVGANAFSELTVYRSGFGMVETGSRFTNASVWYVPQNFFKVFGVKPVRGRLFNDDDFGRGNVVVITDRMWRRHFGTRPELEGATLNINSRPFTVIGVLPPHTQGNDFFVPEPENAIRASRLFWPIARIKSTESIESMQTALRAAEARYAGKMGLNVAPFRLGFRSFRPEPIKLEGFHVAMAGSALGILLIACANVAALMLSRGVSSRRNYALHLALGAGRRDLIRTVVTEVGLIGIAGAAVGVLLAVWSTHIIIASLPEMLLAQGFPTPQWSPRVFAMVLASTLVAILIAALGPAWYAAHTQPSDPLKESAGTTTGRSGTRFRALVIAEMAVSMVLLFGASLMAKSARRLANYDFGYDINSIITTQIAFPVSRSGAVTLSAAQREQAVEGTLARVRAIPGVSRAATMTSMEPDSNAVVSDGSARGEPTFFTSPGWRYRVVGPEFFSIFDAHVIKGRDFEVGDRARGAVILSEGAARALFPHGDAVGRSVRMGDLRSTKPWLQIVGIVPNIKFGALDSLSHEAPMPDIFAMLPDTAGGFVSIVARASRNPAAVIADMQLRLNDFSPAGSRIRTRGWFDNFLTGVRAAEYLGRLFTILGVGSLVLAAVGLFSVLSYVVSQRMREFAVRMALGARSVNVIRLVVSNAMVMALGGTAIGALVGMWAGFLIWNLLWGVYPVDAEALIIAEVTLLIATLAACVIPALRATRANPVDVMRAT